MANKTGVDRRFLNIRFLVIGTSNQGVSTQKYAQYIVGAAPAGNFAGFKPNSIAFLQDDGTWFATPPIIGEMEIIDISTNSVKTYDGTAWVTQLPLGGGGASDAIADPVEAMVTSGATLPTLPGSYSTGDVFLNTADNRLYTVQTDGGDPETLTWDAGVAPVDGARYADTTTGKIMQYNAEDSTYDEITLGDAVIFVDKSTDTLWLHDLPTNSFHQASGTGAIPMATYTVLGGVVIDIAGGLRVDSGKLKVNRVYGEFEIIVTEEDITNGNTFELPQRVIPGREANTALVIGGVRQRYGSDHDFGIYSGVDAGLDPQKDYLIDEGGLSAIGLIAGDVLQVSYEYDPAIA